MTADLPLERVLGPGASDLEAFIASGGDGSGRLGSTQERNVSSCRERQAMQMCLLVADDSMSRAKRSL